MRRNRKTECLYGKQTNKPEQIAGPDLIIRMGDQIIRKGIPSPLTLISDRKKASCSSCIQFFNEGDLLPSYRKPAEKINTPGKNVVGIHDKYLSLWFFSSTITIHKKLDESNKKPLY